MVKVTFKTQDGRTWDVDAEEGVSLMSVAVKNGIPGIEGACGGSMVCGTCHAYPSDPWFSRLPPQSAGEREIIDFSLNVEPNSRLTCQIKVTPDLEGVLILLPPPARY